MKHKLVIKLTPMGWNVCLYKKALFFWYKIDCQYCFVATLLIDMFIENCYTMHGKDLIIEDKHDYLLNVYRKDYFCIEEIKNYD